MIWNIQNTVEAGRRVRRIIDANGLEWDHCIECDTETGRILKLKLGTDGKPFHDSLTGNAVREEVFTAAPLIVIFKDPPCAGPSGDSA